MNNVSQRTCGGRFETVSWDVVAKPLDINIDFLPVDLCLETLIYAVRR
jgi:hypothetical protein